MQFDPAAVAGNVARIRERIARATANAGRRAEDVTLVAISKTFPAAAILAAWDAGVQHFGENRVQEWEAKRPEVADLPATWHLVGHLQSNKARRATRLFGTVDSLDSLDLARRLDAALREEAGAAPERGLRVLLEVRLAPEETKSGVDPQALEMLVRGVVDLPRLDLRGLMCIPPLETEPEEARPYFRRLRELRDALRSSLGGTPVARAATGRGAPFLPVLSMGMSHDFEVAIEEGATEVRLGSALLGARTP